MILQSYIFKQQKQITMKATYQKQQRRVEVESKKNELHKKKI